MNEPYKILLVDDEAEVRTSIIRKIDWSAVGFQVVGDAENGVDALEKIEQLEPDVVLTDIRMPYMDGLEMAERLREIHPSIKVVLFSGFDDFEYAQKAIKLNIIEYILKPVNAEEMMEILLRIKGTLDEEIQRLRDLTNLQESFRKNLPILREKFLSNLVKGNVGKEDIPVLMEEYGLSLLEGKKIAIIGGGPSGLSAAFYLQLMGHQTTVFEMHKHLGGMLYYGIPSYRLPRERLDSDIEAILSTGVDVRLNTTVGGGK